MTYVVTFNDAQPSAREDQVWTDVSIQEAEAATGPWTTLETQTLSPVDTDPEDPAVRDITTTLATLEAGWYRLIFLDADDNQEITAAVSRPPGFATVADIETRLGRDLTDPEIGQVSALLTLVTALIADAVGRDDDWAATLSPVPAIVKVVAIEAVVRILQNPSGATSVQEALGEYSHAERYESGGYGYGLYLSKAEELLLRRLYATSGSVRVASLANDLGVGPADTV